MNNNYVITHIHSMLSNGTTNIDSITNFRDYIKRAKECGMNAICFTEHGNFFEWVHKKEECEKAGLKYIHGAEFYITKNLDEKIRDNYHCVLIAKNYDGVKELNSLSSKSYNRKDGHFYYSPRITYDELINTSDNVIITTACLGGILHKGDELLKDKFVGFLVANKHRCFLEIQHHNVEDQINYNKMLLELSNETGIPLISGTDTHALNDIHMDGRSLLQKSKKVFFDNEDSWDMTFKTYDELVDAYKTQDSLPMKDVLIAINNTNTLADMVEEFELDRSYKYPHLWENPMQVFKTKIYEGLKKRGVDKYPNRKEYIDRINYELQAYVHNQAIDFMLLMEDIIDWCIKEKIFVGYGRGSVNGSVIAWLLGITEMDSIKHGLNFDRFMNVERVSLSDIDTDFPPSRIKEVKDYIFDRTGLYCCDIITFNTVADKGAIRDVGRAMNIPLQDVSHICDCVDNEEKYKAIRNEYKELFDYVDLIKGTIVSVGSHPCGTVVSPYDVDSHIATYTTATSDYPISQINMKEIDGLNYVKLDLLKLDTIEVINNCCEMVGIERITPDNMDINDVDVWNSIREDTTGIFQWEGSTGDNYIKKLLSDDNINSFKEIDENVDRMTLVSIGNSAIRPAGASYRDDLANGIVRKSGSDAIDNFLKPTFGYLVFQCQIIDFLHEYCGFTMGEADIVRRHFAKKVGTDKDIPIIKYGGCIVDGGRHINGFIATMKEKYNMDKDTAETTIEAFLQVIIDASRYLFSLNHSSPYSYLGYGCGYLRYHYPVEFLTCLLNQNKDKTEKTNSIIAYAKKMGIEISPIKFRHSKAQYSCNREEKMIYKGIESIKNMNSIIAEELFNLGGNHYEDFISLLSDIKNHTSVNSRQLDILIKLDFFSEFGEVNKLLDITKKHRNIFGKKNFNKSRIDSYGVDIDMFSKFAIKETDATYVLDCKSVLSLLRYDLENTIIDPCTIKDMIAYQQEYLGYIDYVDKNMSNRFVVITNLDTKYSPKFKAYCIKNGEMCEMKIKRKKSRNNKDVVTCYNDVPVNDGDIIYIVQCKQENRKKLVDGEWTISNEKDWWINEYRKVDKF